MDYVRVVTEEDALSALRREGATPIAGGTDLMIRMRAGQVHPALLVDIGAVESLRAMEARDDGVSIGAATPMSDLLDSPVVRDRLPLLYRALQSVGSVQIRHRATLGGNLVNASPAADGVLALVALDARVRVIGADGQRHTLPVSEFVLGPGRTALQRGQLVQAIEIPFPPRNAVPFYHKVGRRRALTIAIASVAGNVTVRRGLVVDIRLAAGSVAPVPLRLHTVEDAVRGRPISSRALAAARDATALAVSPIDDVRGSAAYRRAVAADLVARCLASAERTAASSPPPRDSLS